MVSRSYREPENRHSRFSLRKWHTKDGKKNREINNVCIYIYICICGGFGGSVVATFEAFRQYRPARLASFWTACVCQIVAVGLLECVQGLKGNEK